ncbi:stealth conserved region 3 domain-containing protein [Pseudactinotalea sp. Z1748]|uniref:stealth family protein n=1 Tax=Pseudactinotalea sp. Z1748 TaxID=3413027 RepID=UPI003C7A2DDF
MRASQLADNLEVATHQARFVVAHREPQVTVWHLAAQTADDVADALRSAGVQFFAMHRPNTRLSRWGVPRHQLARAVMAMGQDLGNRAFYYQLAPRAPGRLVAKGLTAEELATTEEFRIFRYVRCGITGRIYGAAEGCSIAVWDEDDERDTFFTLDRGSITQEIDRTESLPLATRLRWDGRPEPVLAGVQRDASSIEFPIDAVYLWVDDSDPRWRARRSEVRRSLGMEDSSGAASDETIAAHRFRDRGELRASLRSLQMYAPWIRNIYLVTDQQRPEWLDADHGRITIVDHREIFTDPGVLPSYNSHAISSQIHRIPGLSERYLLMNDDVMFNRPVTPYHFFTPTGALRIFFSRSRRPDISRSRQTSLERARSNSADLLQRDFGRHASLLFGHVAVPQRKDIAEELEQRYAEEIARTVASPFRAETDVVVNSWLHMYTALFTGRGVSSRIRYGYFNVGRPEVREKMEREGYTRRFQIVCLNDVPPPGGEDDADPEWLADWLMQAFPIPAPFELPSGR